VIVALSKVRAFWRSGQRHHLPYMSDFGGKLRAARERRGLSLRQIAASTKISIAALEALERNDVSKLPGGIFSRAFVRSYAMEVGLDPDAAVHEFLERFQGTPSVQPAAPAGVTPPDNNDEIQRRVLSVAVKVAIVTVPIIGLGLFVSWRARHGDAGSARAPVTAPTTRQSAPPTSTAPSSSSGLAPPATPTAAAPAAVPGVMTLELHPTGNCWVRLTVDGRTVLAKLMLAGEKEVRPVREEAIIEVGDAGAFAFSIDGRRGKPLGQPGQVRTARITRPTLARYLE
jgi:cytoskeleton protein RodZ